MEEDRQIILVMEVVVVLQHNMAEQVAMAVEQDRGLAFQMITKMQPVVKVMRTDMEEAVVEPLTVLPVPVVMAA